MKITVAKNSIMPILKKASKVSNAKSTVMILGHVAIKSSVGILNITANDSRKTYSESCECSGDDFSMTLDLQKLLRAVNAFKTGDIDIYDDGQVNQGRSKIQIDHLPYDHFPMPNYEKAEKTSLKSSDLNAAIAVVSHAMPVKDVRPMLNGIHLTTGYVVATDGHRLAYLKSDYDGIDLIIPSDAANSINIDGDVYVSENQLIVRNDNSVFSTGLLTSRYVDWRRVLPSGSEDSVFVLRKSLLDALDMCSINESKVLFTIKNGELKLSNNGSEVFVEIESKIDMQIGFNIQYLQDALRMIEKETIEIKFFGESKQILIEDSFVIMPMRV